MGESDNLTENQMSWSCCHTLDSASEKLVPSLTATSSISLLFFMSQVLEAWMIDFISGDGDTIIGTRCDLCFLKDRSGCCAENRSWEQEKSREW